MALTLISILMLANVALTAPVVPRQTACKFIYYSQEGDTCKSIGLSSGYYDTDIHAANTYLNCDDIWEGSPICIPDIPYPITVTYRPTASTSTTSMPLPTPVCMLQYSSDAGDTCDGIGTKFGITGTDVYNANTYLNCNDIWENSPICIPGIFYPPPSTPPSYPSCMEYYRSVEGDTCASIGEMWGFHDYEISAANSFVTCDDIWVNTPICLPSIPTPTISVLPLPTCFTTYTSVAGDTCDSIGAEYGISGTEIFNANSYLNCEDIWAWTVICVPNMVIVDPYPTDLTVDASNPITCDPFTGTVTGGVATATPTTIA